MPIEPTPPDKVGTVEEDEIAKGNLGMPAAFVAGIYDRVAMIIKNGLILDAGYGVTGKNISITKKRIQEMTEESSRGKIFYVFNIDDIFLFSRKKINEEFVIKYVAIVIAGGKRYKVVNRGKKWIKEAESIDFNFVEIEKEDILRIAEEGTAKGQLEVTEK